MAIFRIFRRERITVLCAAALMLAACGSGGDQLFEPIIPDSQEDAGTVNLAVNMVAPWDEFAAKLSPGFKLTGEQAVAKVLPTTSILDEKFLDGVVGTFAATISRTGTAGTPAEAPAAPPTRDLSEASAGALPSLADRRGELAADQFLVHKAAAALFQEVQLLNQFVEKAALRRGFRPYVVRLQIGVLPNARNQPLDILSTLSFFPFEFDAGVPGRSQPARNSGAYVVPLVVTDNLEQTLKSRTTDIIRQFALALRFLSIGGSGDASINKLNEQLRSILGTDTNSLFTVGRITDNSIQVRLGAAQQATAQFAMVPRTHDVTLLVMVPLAFADTLPADVNSTSFVKVVARSEMRRTDTGKLLPHAPFNQGRIETIDILKEFTGDPLPLSLDKLKSQGRYPKEKYALPGGQSLFGMRRTPILNREKLLGDLSRDLIAAVLLNRLDWFEQDLRDAGLSSGFAENMWIELVDRISKSPVTASTFQLPRTPLVELPDTDSAVLLSDDGKKSLTVQIAGGRNMKADRIAAEIEWKDKPALKFAATQTAVGGSGAVVTLTFPSPIVWKVNTRSGGKLTIRYDRANVWTANADQFSSAGARRMASASYENFVLRDPAPAQAVKKPSGFTVSADAKTVVADRKTNRGAVNLVVKIDTKAAAGAVLPSFVDLKVAGAAGVLKATLDPKGAAPTQIKPEKDGAFSVAGNAQVRLELENLIPHAEIRIEATGFHGKLSGGKTVKDETKKTGIETETLTVK